LKVLILGAAGFIGSNLVYGFLEDGHEVIALDGFLEKTGGDKKHLENVINKIVLIDQKIEHIDSIPELINSVDIVIDSMAWTSHWLAIEDPFYDLELNAKAHLSLLARLPENTKQKFIFLGSRVQYGKSEFDLIDEESPMFPEDIQGIHKLTAESYFRVYSKLKNIDVISLRFANCFGINQPTNGRDIGLIGTFIKNALLGKTIEVYGEDRKRPIVYVNDLVNIVIKLANKDFSGFNPFNIKGIEISIYQLAKIIIAISGNGCVSLKKMPDEIGAIDIGDVEFSNKKIIDYLGVISETDLTKSLSKTIEYFKISS